MQFKDKERNQNHIYIIVRTVFSSSRKPNLPRTKTVMAVVPDARSWFTEQASAKAASVCRKA